MVNIDTLISFCDSDPTQRVEVKPDKADIVQKVQLFR